MPNVKSPLVDTFINELVHSRKPEIEQLRDAILAAPIEITEQVKWNAPSFCCDGDDRVTFRLHPGNRVELVFHRGAKKRADTSTFTFHDPVGHLKWLAPRSRCRRTCRSQRHKPHDCGRRRTRRSLDVRNSGLTKPCDRRLYLSLTIRHTGAMAAVFGSRWWLGTRTRRARSNTRNR